MYKQFVLVALFASARSQFSFDNPRPDITFDDHNDRFDISPMMQEDRLFRESEDNRRFDTGSLLKKLLKARRNYEEFAYQDTMADDESSVKDFEENLKAFEKPKPGLRTGPEVLENEEKPDYPKIYRRIGNEGENKVLMDYAVPIDFKLQGYLKP